MKKKNHFKIIIPIIACYILMYVFITSVSVSKKQEIEQVRKKVVSELKQEVTFNNEFIHLEKIYFFKDDKHLYRVNTEGKVLETYTLTSYDFDFGYYNNELIVVEKTPTKETWYNLKTQEVIFERNGV